MARQVACRILVGCKGLLATPGAAHRPFRAANWRNPHSGPRYRSAIARGANVWLKSSIQVGYARYISRRARFSRA